VARSAQSNNDGKDEDGISTLLMRSGYHLLWSI